MKKLVNFLLLPADDYFKPCGNYLPIKQMKELRRRWPQFFEEGKRGFHFLAELGDPLINEVVSYLRTTGREPNWNWCPSVTTAAKMAGLPYDHPTLYQVHGNRVWDTDDIDRAEYFELHVTREVCDSKLLPPDGIPEVSFGSYRGRPVGISVTMSNPICSEDFRKELEKQKFKGLTFRRAKIKSRKPEKLVLWQIWSSVTLPPVLSPIFGVEGEPFDPSASIACYVNDIFFPWQHRYSAIKIKKLEPFDVAISTERWGYGYTHQREPAIIVSRRFRDWFMTQKVPVEWWPVAFE